MVGRVVNCGFVRVVTVGLPSFLYSRLVGGKDGLVRSDGIGGSLRCFL